MNSNGKPKISYVKIRSYLSELKYVYRTIRTVARCYEVCHLLILCVCRPVNSPVLMT